MKTAIEISLSPERRKIVFYCQSQYSRCTYKRTDIDGLCKHLSGDNTCNHSSARKIAISQAREFLNDMEARDENKD
jgi:hypothetical protein